MGNVLIRWPAAAVRKDIQKELGLNNDQFNLFVQKYILRLSKGEISEEELWAEAQKDFGLRAVSVSENLLARKFQADAIVYSDVLEFAKKLKKDGYKIAILSNTISAHEKVCINKGVTEPFDHIFLSYQVGLRKPDPKFYYYVLDKLGVKPTEALFIDDIKENVEAASNLGIRTIWADHPATIVEKAMLELK